MPRRPEERTTKSEKLADIAKFDGSRDQIRGFVVQLRMKVQILNRDRFPTEQDKIAYAISRLEGEAMQQVLPHIAKSGAVTLPDLNALITLLETAFDDLYY